MADFHDFHPDPARARELDARMHDALADSLAYIGTRLVEAAHVEGDPFAEQVAAIRAGARFGPEVFGTYYRLSFALLEDDFVTAGEARAAIAAARPAGDGLIRSRWGDPAIAERIGIYADRMAGETSGIVAATQAEAEAFFARLDEGFALLDHACPELAGEIRAILREVVVAAPDPASEMAFDGASHYQLWGLLLLNAQHHETRLAVAEVLAHEAGHSLLFGFTIDAPLTLNGDDERYASPLRPDPRPMDGIYHATYVSARMSYAMRRLADSPALSSAERAQARAQMERDMRSFDAGHSVVAEHGRLSEPGAALMASARAFMETL